MRRLVIGLLAHVDAGKTTLAEAMLHRSGAIRDAGRVDHRDTFLDTDSRERSRGITIFSKQAQLEWADCALTLLDTPGHADFAAEMERTLAVLDAAVLLLGANDGVRPYTELLWKLLQKNNVPVFVFVNKMDLSLRQKEQILAELTEKLSPDCVDFSRLPENGAAPADFWEDLAAAMPDWIDPVLEGKTIPDKAVTEAFRRRQVFPCWFGSALKEEGIDALLSGMARFAGDPNGGKEKEPFGALVYKIGRGARGERLSFLKVTQGTLAVKDTITESGPDGRPEKADQLRLYSGEKYKLTEQAEPGMIVAVTGPAGIQAGTGLGAAQGAAGEVMEPFLKYEVLNADGDERAVYAALTALAEEDPKLYAEWDAASGRAQVCLMGQVQQEILTDLLLSRYGLTVTFGPPRILYRETITATAEGIGHFEPLRHYAEVHLILEPAERGSGLTFATSVKEDDLDRNWQRLILTHLEERSHPGVLTGAPITDMKITLAAGRASKKHTEGGDFRQATYRAVRCGLRKASPALLEPWFAFRMELPERNVGRAMTEIGNLSGTAEITAQNCEKTVLEGRAPAAGLMQMQQDMISYTGGQGAMQCRLDGYDLCHDAAEVVSASGYDPDRDAANPADSVFPTHGASEIVSWRDVEARMDLPSCLRAAKAVPADEDSEAQARRAAAYRERAATDAELFAIFERTYGPVKRHPLTAPGRRERAPEQPRTAEIRAKHTKKAGPQEPVRQLLYIDGYNVIHDWEELSALARTDYGAARQKLQEVLCNYASYTGIETTVVFDAYRVKGGTGHEEEFHGLRIVYTKEDETADAWLERATRTIPAGTRVTVVSSDALIQQISLGHGALRMSSRELEEDVQAAEDRIRAVLEESVL